MTATIWNVLSDPWSQAIMRRAFAEVALLGIAGGALGCWVVFYNLSYSAESLSHALLPGLVVAALTGLPLLLGGAAGLLVAAICIALAGSVTTIGRDTAVAVAVTGLFGLGALLALSPDTPAGLGNLLFGDPLAVTNGDLVLGALVAVAVATVLRLLHGRLVAVAFDRATAKALGIGPLAIDATLLALLAVVLLVAVGGLGNLLVIALLIAPATAARLVATRMPAMLLWGAAIAVIGGAAGLYLSYYAGTAAGASIAAMLIATLAAIACVRSLVRLTASERAA
jgi:ABC-type Mn2+/Zn2+ transport system permease subunit